jgi:hypothetical protein
MAALSPWRASMTLTSAVTVSGNNQEAPWTTSGV